MIARTLAAMGAAALLAGCGSVPAYYTSRVSAQPSSAAVAAADAGPREEAPPRRVAKRPRPKRVPSTEVAAAETGSPAPATVDNTGSASAARPRPSEASVRRDRAIERTLNSICSGC